MNYREYHVSKNGSDCSAGTKDVPFATIQKAADVAEAGDKIIVHEGVYREWVKPQRGGLSEDCRITYEAAGGEHVVIKGSERITGWCHVEGTVWKVSVDNAYFQGWNPYTHPVKGDWIVDPRDYDVHVGEVYLNGVSFYEAVSLDAVYHPTKREFSPHETWGRRKERILKPENTLYQWYCKVDEEKTTIGIRIFLSAERRKREHTAQLCTVAPLSLWKNILRDFALLGTVMWNSLQG